MSFDKLLDIVFRKGLLILIIFTLLCTLTLSGCVVFDMAACLCNVMGCEGMESNWIEASTCHDEACYGFFGPSGCGSHCGIADCLYNPAGCHADCDNGCVIDCGGANYGCIAQLCSGQLNPGCYPDENGHQTCNFLNCKGYCK